MHHRSRLLSSSPQESASTSEYQDGEWRTDLAGLRSAGTRRIPADGPSVVPPNVAWWPHHAGRSKTFPAVAARDAVFSLESSNRTSHMTDRHCSLSPISEGSGPFPARRFCLTVSSTRDSCPQSSATSPCRPALPPGRTGAPSRMPSTAAPGGDMSATAAPIEMGSHVGVARSAPGSCEAGACRRPCVFPAKAHGWPTRGHAMLLQGHDFGTGCRVPLIPDAFPSGRRPGRSR